jgi:hypothetical protein
MGRYAEVAATRAQDGFSPLLQDFTNTRFLLSNPSSGQRANRSTGQPVPIGHPSEGQLRPSATLVRLGQNAAVSEYQ